MSITEKLAQALRDVLDPAAKAERDGRKFDSYVLRHPETYKRIAREALAEYDASQSTPAGEVTADAVEVASDAYAELALEGVDMTAMQAALAVAFPALVQQVEDMKESVHQWRRQYNMEFERCDALSAANARLSAIAKEATCMGLAAIATYGRRDENGLCGLSKKHWAELVVLQDATKGEK